MSRGAGKLARPVLRGDRRSNAAVLPGNRQATLRPTRAASTLNVLPCSDTVAVLVTVRCSHHWNASCSCAGVGSRGGAAAASRASGLAPVSAWGRVW